MGQLEEDTIKQGYKILQEISELLKKPQEGRTEALEYLSNRFYTYIPHQLDKDSMIDSEFKVKACQELISSLIDMKIILKNERRERPKNPIDLNY
jgi:hypothetical protein